MVSDNSKSSFNKSIKTILNILPEENASKLLVNFLFSF